MVEVKQGSSLCMDIESGSIQCVVTSPPYWGLRKYDGEQDSGGFVYGLEKTPELYVEHTILFLREIWRVLKDDGVVFWNVGDSYAANRSHQVTDSKWCDVGNTMGAKVPDGLKPKDLCLIPFRVALAAQADGWWVRSDIIWCLSGGTWLYVRSQKGDMPMTVKDMARLDPSTVKLWNGEKWTRLLGMSKSPRKGGEIELVLRSGERISCTPTHRFPTGRGLLDAADIKVGDVLQSCRLPEPDKVKDCAINEDAAWLAGLYIAEGSRSGDTIQIAGHAKEDVRWNEIQRIAEKFGGSATRTVDGHNMSIRVYGRVLNAIIDELVTGHDAHDKAFAPVVWRYSDAFLDAMLTGYLSGDGHYDAANNRWRLGFCRNYNLERDLRTACARLGYKLTLNLASVPYNGKPVPTFKGELRMTRNNHWNEKDRNEIVAIHKARCREVYDIGVEDEPHLFALASGVLTHNSKPNPMPESVRDRPTSSYEHIFMFTKSKDYYWDQDAVREPSVSDHPSGNGFKREARVTYQNQDGSARGRDEQWVDVGGARNIRDVWTIATQPSGFKHYAAFPLEIPTRCIKAATSQMGECPKCGKPWVRVTERTPMVIKRTDWGDKAGNRTATSGTMVAPAASKTVGWQPTCNCGLDPVPQTVLDPFCGTGRTLYAAQRLGRNAIGYDLSEKYCDMARQRCGLI